MVTDYLKIAEEALAQMALHQRQADAALTRLRAALYPPAIGGIPYEEVSAQTRRMVASEQERIADTIRGLDWEGCGGWGCSDNKADLLGQVLAIVMDEPSQEWAEYASESVQP
jgi:hypothetical protein